MPVEHIPVTDRASWLAMRQRDVTASVAGCLLGVHDYTTAYGLWATKTGRIPADTAETEAMVRGTLLEPVAAQLVAMKRSEWTIIEPGVYLRDPEARIGATPDRWVECPERGRGTLQIKTTADLIFKQKWRDPDTREVVLPLWIAVQAMLEADLAGHSWACVAVMVVGMGLDVHLIDVPIKPALLQRLRTEVAEFWRIVDSGEKMPPDYAQDGALVARVYDRGNEPPIDLSGDNRMVALLDDRAELKVTEKATKARLEEVETEIKHKLGNASAATVGGRTVSWKLQRRAEYTVKASEFRVLRVA